MSCKQTDSERIMIDKIWPTWISLEPQFDSDESIFLDEMLENLFTFRLLVHQNLRFREHSIVVCDQLLLTNVENRWLATNVAP